MNLINDREALSSKKKGRNMEEDYFEYILPSLMGVNKN